MVDHSKQPATMADVQFLAELITKNTGKINSLEERMDSFEDRLDDLKETIIASVAKIDHSFQGLSKIVGWHDGKIFDLDKRVAELEMAA